MRGIGPPITASVAFLGLFNRAAHALGRSTKEGSDLSGGSALRVFDQSAAWDDQQQRGDPADEGSEDHFRDPNSYRHRLDVLSADGLNDLDDSADECPPDSCIETKCDSSEDQQYSDYQFHFCL